jgi:putative redox protein
MCGSVEVSHEKTHASEVGSAIDGDAPIDHFTRQVTLEGDLTPEMRQKMMQIADRCPVHKTMERGAHITTRESEA